MTPEQGEKIKAEMKEIADHFFFLLGIMQGDSYAYQFADTAIKCATREFIKFAKQNLNEVSLSMRETVANRISQLESRQAVVKWEPTHDATKGLPNKASFEAGFEAGWKSAIELAKANGANL